MRALIVSSLLFIGCYSPLLGSGSFACGVNDLCPDGLGCVDGLCVTQVGTGDLREIVPPPADLSTGQTDPCAAGWAEIMAGSIYACKRTFTVTGGNFTDLCRPGYHACSSADDLSAVSFSSSAKCNAAGGFYLTQVDIALRNIDSGDRTADGICAPQTTDQARALLGCGSESGLYRLGSSGCNQLKATLRCASAPSGWNCTSAREVSHTGAQGGLLCCVNL